jgi:hypothetical protein
VSSSLEHEGDLQIIKYEKGGMKRKSYGNESPGKEEHSQDGHRLHGHAVAAGVEGDEFTVLGEFHVHPIVLEDNGVVDLDGCQPA